MLKYHNPRWLQLYNEGSYEIPAYGIVEITGASYDLANPDAPALMLKGDRPSADGLLQIAINSWKPIPYGETGLVTMDGPVLVDAGSVSAATGDSIGSQENSFLPSEDFAGITIFADMGDGRLLVDFASGSQQKRPFCLFQADTAFDTTDSSVSGTIETQYGEGVDHASLSATFLNHKTHTAGTYLFVGDEDDYGTALYSGEGTEWHIVQFECP